MNRSLNFDLFSLIFLFQVPIKITEGLDPLTLLTDNATIAGWNNENLPSDRMSTENATILTNCERWPLMIDPQLQGVKWIKTREGEELRVVRLGQKGYVGITAFTHSQKRLRSKQEKMPNFIVQNIEEQTAPNGSAAH